MSQQIKAVETALGVENFERTHRGVELTAAGEAFVQEARRALNAADRVAQRAQAAARGEVGTLRLAYTLATVHETLPALIDALAAKHPELKVAPKEVFAEDIERLLADERIDLALAPHVGHRRVLDQRPIRLEPFVAAVAENHPLAAEPQVPLAALADETIELWPQPCHPATTTPSWPPAATPGSNRGSTIRPQGPPSDRCATSCREASPCYRSPRRCRH